MSVIENKLWSDFEPFINNNDEVDIETDVETDVIEMPTVLGPNYTLFELLVNDLKQENIYDFINLDWKCLSAMKGFSLHFIRENFRYFNIYTLITTNNFDEKFLVEILDGLIPFNERTFNKIFDRARILRVFKETNKTVLSEEFTSRSYSPCKTVYKEYKNSNVLINQSFENIVNYLKEEHPKEYLELDVKCFSSFRVLSTKFVLEHIHKLDIGMLFTNQKFDLDFIKKLNQIVNVPFNPLFVSHIKKLSLEFILELIPFDKTVKDKKNREKIKKSIVNNVLPITFNKSLGVTIDDSILYKNNIKKNPVITSYDTMYLKHY